MASRKKRNARDGQLYRGDLAKIHVDGYGFHWEAAAPVTLRWLRDAGITSGEIVDLGCGGGEWVRFLADNGYQTVGVDISSSMIQIARKNSPATRFICASFAEATIPECDAATSIGEPLNYLNSGSLMRKTIRNVFKSLRPGGLFVFDVRHPPAGPVPAINHNRTDDDWFCHALVEEDEKQLTRTITTFRRVGDNRFRRDREVHRLKLFSKEKVSRWLRDAGFRVRTRRSYGDYKLAARQSVFVCRKPD